MTYILDRHTGRVHIHRRFSEPDECEAWCGHRIRPVYLADFVKEPKQNQCIQCQDRKWKEGNDATTAPPSRP